MGVIHSTAPRARYDTPECRLKTVLTSIASVQKHFDLDNRQFSLHYFTQVHFFSATITTPTRTDLAEALRDVCRLSRAYGEPLVRGYGFLPTFTPEAADEQLKQITEVWVAICSESGRSHAEISLRETRLLSQWEKLKSRVNVRWRQQVERAQAKTEAFQVRLMSKLDRLLAAEACQQAAISARKERENAKSRTPWQLPKRPKWDGMMNDLFDKQAEPSNTL